MTKTLLPLIMIVTLSSNISASCSSSDSTYSMSEREYCEAGATGSGAGAGLAATINGKKFSDNNEILSYCVATWNSSRDYYSAYKKVYINGCLSNWGISLRD